MVLTYDTVLESDVSRYSSHPFPHYPSFLYLDVVSQPFSLLSIHRCYLHSDPSISYPRYPPCALYQPYQPCPFIPATSTTSMTLIALATHYYSSLPWYPGLSIQLYRPNHPTKSQIQYHV